MNLTVRCTSMFNHAETLPKSLSRTILSTCRGGRRFDSTTIDLWSRRLRCDLRSVRWHGGGLSNRLCSELDAEAFVLGRDVFFASDRYEPSTEAGRRLIAHELVHAAQQRNCVPKTDACPELGSVGDYFEHEAESLAELAVDGWLDDAAIRTTLLPRDTFRIQRAVANQVGAIAGAAGGVWNQIPTTCLFGVCYWLYCEEFGSPPTANAFLNVNNLNAVIATMIQMGTALSRPAFGNANLTSGSVLIFTDVRQPLHGCIATGANTIGGYNQLNWFTGPGVNHGYSTHNSGEIQWRGLTHPAQVRRNMANQWCQLVQVGEMQARAVVRAAFQGQR